jgi:hypothetical protein
MRFHTRLVFFAVALPGLCVAMAARAGDRGAQERAARKACLSGDYAKGIELLSDLFLDTRDPTHIFNQGRCYEQNSRYGEAIARFREYLRKATKIAPSDRADTEKHIADCQALLAQPEKAAVTPAAPTPVLVPEPPPAEPTVPVARSAQASTTAETARSGRGLRIAGVLCGLVGLVSIGTGIYYYSRARSLSETVNPSPSVQQDGKDAETMQWVFYSVGAAGVVAGTGLFLWGWRSNASTDAPAAAIGPMVGPGLAGLWAQGVF